MGASILRNGMENQRQAATKYHRNIPKDISDISLSVYNFGTAFI
jgi:hypothetical protein